MLCFKLNHFFSCRPKITDVIKVERIFRLVIFVDDDLADVVALDPERKVDVQVGVAENDFEMLNAAFKKSKAKNIFSHFPKPTLVAKGSC